MNILRGRGRGRGRGEVGGRGPRRSYLVMATGRKGVRFLLFHDALYLLQLSTSELTGGPEPKPIASSPAARAVAVYGF